MDGAKEFPFLGWLMDYLPIWWTLTIWRIHKKNAAVGVADLAERAVSGIAGETAGGIAKTAVRYVPMMGAGEQTNQPESKEDTVARQIAEDSQPKELEEQVA